jgi:hypothetical protein
MFRASWRHFYETKWMNLRGAGCMATWRIAKIVHRLFVD